MPWLPEVFTAPVMEQILEQRRRDALVAVPYFDGLLVGDPDPLVESFAREPEVHDPVRGRVKGEAAFRAFVIETSAWLRDHHASVDDGEHVILERHGFEEVVLRLDGGALEVPITVVADRQVDGRIDEVRVYFNSRLLTGRHAHRPPLLQADPALAVPAAVADFYAQESDGAEVALEPCALVDDGRVAALEHNVVRPGSTQPLPQAGVAVLVRGESGEPPAVRVYDDLRPPRPA
jgi:hypothetical protein